MAIILPQPSAPQAGASDSVAGAIALLNQSTARQTQRGNTQQALQALGYSPQEAGALSGLDQNFLAQIVKQRTTGPTSGYQNALSGILSAPGEISDEMLQAALQGRNEKETKAISDVFFKKKGEISKAFKDTEDVRDEISKLAQAAETNDWRLERLQKLSEGDKLQNPSSYFNRIMSTVYNATHKEGEAGWWTKETQEFKKLQTDFLSNAKNIFGARVTNYEMQQYLNSIPSLIQTKEGRLQVINDLKLMGQAARLRLQAMNKIIADNNGVPPRDLRMQIDELIKPQMDQIGQMFVNGIDAGTRYAESLKEKYKVGAKFDTMPPADQVPPNTKIRINPKEYVESNGYKWIKRKG